MLLQNINIFVYLSIYNTFCSATFYNDPPMITHAVAQELGPQEVKDSELSMEVENRPKIFLC